MPAVFIPPHSKLPTCSSNEVSTTDHSYCTPISSVGSRVYRSLPKNLWDLVEITSIEETASSAKLNVVEKADGLTYNLDPFR